MLLKHIRTMIFKLKFSAESNWFLIQLITSGFILVLRCQIHLLLSKRSLTSQLHIVTNAYSPVVNTLQRELSFLIKLPMKVTQLQKLHVNMIQPSSRIWLFRLLLIIIWLMKNYLKGYKHVILFKMVEFNKLKHGIIQMPNFQEITVLQVTTFNTSMILLP